MGNHREWERGGREGDRWMDAWTVTESQRMRKREQDRQMDNHRG